MFRQLSNAQREQALGTNARREQAADAQREQALASSSEREQALATMSTQSRRLRNGLVSLAIFFGLIVALMLAVPGLRSVAERMSDANASWIVVGIALELLSCAGYVLLFELVFGMERRFSVRLSLAELAVNSVVSVSGAGGIALGAWVLRTKGVQVERIARRSVLMFVLTSAVNVGAVALIGVPMWLGLLPGSRNPLLTLLPAALAFAAIVATLGFAVWAERLKARGEADNGPRGEAHDEARSAAHDEARDGAHDEARSAAHNEARQGRLHVALVTTGEGVYDALRLVRGGDWRLLGAIGYWLFDTLVLYVCLIAYGPTPELWAVAMAYLVGLFANSIPLPGGMLAVEGGVIGMLVLFGVRPASLVVAAVVTYRAISLWLPAAIGSFAFWTLRHDIGEPLPASAGGGG